MAPSSSSSSSRAKQRAESFSSAEQSLLLELYEQHRSVISTRGNTTAVNKAREGAWQSIAGCLNASNLSGQRRSWQQVKIKYKNILSNAAKKQTEHRATAAGPPPPPPPSAETLDLSLNKGLQLEGGSSTPADPFAKGRGHHLLQLDLDPSQPQEDPQDTGRLYKTYLQLSIEHKRLQIKKLQLEIQQMEKDPDSLE